MSCCEEEIGLLEDIYELLVVLNESGRLPQQPSDTTIDNQIVVWDSITNKYIAITSVEDLEVDPIYSASVAATIDLIDIFNWNEAFSWGNHALAGYATVGGLNKQVQYNDNDVLNGMPLEYDNVLNKLTGTHSFQIDLTGSQDFNINVTNAGNYSQYYLNEYGFNTYASSTGYTYESGIEAQDDYVALYSRIGAVTNFATFNNTEAKLTWLTGTGNRLVAANDSGVLSTAPLTYDAGLFTLDASWTSNLVGSGLFFKTGIESATQQTEYYQNDFGIDLYAQSISGNEYSGIGNNKNYVFLYAAVGATENYIEIGYNYIDISTLAGTGTEMLVVNSTGRLARQAIATPFTTADARTAISETITGVDYNNTTGVLSLTSGYVIPTTTNETNWNSAYTASHSAVTLSVTGLTLTGQAISTTAGYGIPTTTKQTQWDTVYTLAGTAITAGQVVYAGTSGVLSGSDNNKWVAANNQLLLGNPTSPATSTRVAIKGTGSTSATYSLAIDNSSNTRLLTVADNGIIFFGATARTNYIFQSANDLLINVAAGSAATTLTYQASNTVTNAHSFVVAGAVNTITGTSGAINIVVAGNSSPFQPTSGTMTYSSFKSGAQINQTGTATGKSRGFWVADTLTSAYDYTGIDISPTMTLITSAFKAYNASMNYTASSGSASIVMYNSSGTYNLTGTNTSEITVFSGSPTFTSLGNYKYSFAKVDLGSAVQNGYIQLGANGLNRFVSKTIHGHATNTPTALVDIEGTTGYNQLRLRTTYTPTNSADANGSIGDICIDGTYIYWKVATLGWLRAVGATW